MDDHLKKIKKFIYEERPDYSKELNLNTELQKDLMLYGDEASDFLMRFCTHFGIEYGQFEFDRYFKPEPSWCDFFQRKRSYDSFQVSHLLNAIFSGRLK